MDTYEPGNLNAGSIVPSVPNTTAFLPCSRSVTATACAFEATWNGVNATSVSLSILFTIAEKSVVLFVTENRCTATPFDFRYASTVSARPWEYGSWASKTATFLAPSLRDHVLGVTGALDAVVRDDAEECGRRRLRLAADALRQRRVRRGAA